VQSTQAAPIPLTLAPMAQGTPSPSEPQPSAAYRQGQADRLSWESWFSDLTGDERAGADYWAAHRSLPNPGSCSVVPPSTGADWSAGCVAAQQKLAAWDVRRKSEPDYRLGWNNPAPVASSPLPPAEPPPPNRGVGNGPAKAVPDWSRPIYARAGVPACFDENDLQTLMALIRDGQFDEVRKLPGCIVLPPGKRATVLTTDGLIDIYFKVALADAGGSPMIVWASGYGFQN
jgi:hypothetical protein